MEEAAEDVAVAEEEAAVVVAAEVLVVAVVGVEVVAEALVVAVVVVAEAREEALQAEAEVAVDSKNCTPLIHYAMSGRRKTGMSFISTISILHFTLTLSFTNGNLINSR